MGQRVRKRDPYIPHQKVSRAQEGLTATQKEKETTIPREEAGPFRIRRRVAFHQLADAEVRWWLQMGVGAFRIRALYDPGASRTVMGLIGLQLASACGRALSPSQGGEEQE